MLASFWGSSLIVIYSNIVPEVTKKETNDIRTRITMAGIRRQEKHIL